MLKETRYDVASRDKKRTRAEASVSSKSIEKILTFLANNQPCLAYNLSKELGLDFYSTKNAVSFCEKLGLIEIIRMGKTNVMWLSDFMQEKAEEGVFA